MKGSIFVMDVCDTLSSNLLTKTTHYRKANYPQTDHFGDIFLNRFPSEALKRHVEDCRKVNNCRIRLSESDKSIINSKNYMNSKRIPLIFCPDLKSVLKPINDGNISRVYSC